MEIPDHSGDWIAIIDSWYNADVTDALVNVRC